MYSRLRIQLEENGQLQITDALNPGERAVNILWIGVCVDTGANLGEVKLPFLFFSLLAYSIQRQGNRRFKPHAHLHIIVNVKFL
jgi:hypothetical protein